MSKKRVKLTAGGNEYVSEFLRFTCPTCKDNFYIHPSKWGAHVEKCSRESSQHYLIFLFEVEKNETTKRILGKLILSRSRAESS